MVHGDKELIEKLGRNDPCPCGSARLFQALLPPLGLLLTAPAATTISADAVPDPKRIARGAAHALAYRAALLSSAALFNGWWYLQSARGHQYSRPFAVAAIALIKASPAAHGRLEVIVLVSINWFVALCFGIVLFTHPADEKRNEESAKPEPG